MPLHADTVKDVATVSNFREVKTIHHRFDFDIQFEKKEINAFVKLTMQSLQDGLEEVILDVHEAVAVKTAHFVKGGSTTESLQFRIEPFTKYGQSLILPLPSSCNKGDQFDLEIEYVSGHGSCACWFDPSQTKDKVKPLVYTQGHPVATRSLFPCQDTPAVKATYSAYVQVPEGITALMSAGKRSFGEKTNRKGNKEVFYFEQDNPIQSYLVALAAGDLKSAEIGPRSKVWAEPSMLDKAQAELKDDVERFLSVGESLFGEYIWGPYDVMIMPQSYPFGGIENPSLTFLTPTIISGDKTLTGLVMHEIGHSWFGNMATPAIWSECWLNEGFAMYAQRRIEEVIYGRPAMCMEAAAGQGLLRRHIERQGNDHPITKLRFVIDENVDLSDTYNSTPYEKGYCFVTYLCSLVGNVDKFDEFLKAYAIEFKYKSIVSEDFFDFFLEYFPELKAEKIDEKPGFEFHKTWLNTPGHAPFTPDLSAKEELSNQADMAAQIFCTTSGQVDQAPDMSQWHTHQVFFFLDILSKHSPLPEGCMKRLTDTYPFLSKSQNCEIRYRWCEIIIKNDAEDLFENIRRFLRVHGAQKHCLAVYSEMVKGSAAARQLAVEIFQETQDSLHSQVLKYVTQILNDAGLVV